MNLFSQARCIAIFCGLATLLLPQCRASSDFSSLRSPHALLSSGGDISGSDLLDQLLNAETSGIKRQIEQYKRKVAILKTLLAHSDDDNGSGGDRNASSNATSVQTEQSRRTTQLQQSRQRSYRQQQQHGATQRFSD